MTCRDCIEEGTATGGPCTEPRHQAGPRFVRTGPQLWAALIDRTDERDRARRWAVALEQECARTADQVRVLTATVSAVCDATGLDTAALADITETAMAAAAAAATTRERQVSP